MKMPAFPRINWAVTALPTAIAIVYLALIWLPGNRAITDVQDRVETQRQFVVDAAGLPAMLADRQRELDAAEAAIARWKKAAPRNRRLAAYFEKIDAVAREAGLTVARFDTQPAVGHETIREVPLVIDCSGGFAHVHEFLRNLERLPATVWIESIEIENMKNSAKDVTCKVNLVGFSAGGATAGSPGRVGCSATTQGGASSPVSWQQTVTSTRDPFQSPQPVASHR